MPTFTAIALDRLLEPGASKSMSTAKNVPDSKLERRYSTPNSMMDRATSAPNSKLERKIGAPDPKLGMKNGQSTAMAINNKHHWAQPALYATPESKPLPDSPSSFPPSPYIINHKRRGPRLLKSFSEDDVATRGKALDEGKVAESEKNLEKEIAITAKDDNFTSREIADSAKKDDNFTFTIPSPVKEEHVNGKYNGELGSSDFSNSSAAQNGKMKSVVSIVASDNEVDDFFDPQDSTSVKSNNTEVGSNGGGDRSLNLTTPMAEFYDAWEELSSESGPQLPLHDVEAELREIRLSLLMEIEKRKQAEEAVNNMRNQWLSIREQLSLVGLKLPTDPIAAADDEQLGDPGEELCQHIDIARFVSNSVGRGTAKAELEMEMEAQIESKNFEIARLLDRLHYYEAVNREMSQRNQETVESARRLRQRRKRRQRWVWGSIAVAVTFGTAALAWSYLPSGKSSSSTNQAHASEGDHGSK